MSDELSCICMRDRSVCNCDRPAKIEQKINRECLCGRSPNGKCLSWHALPEKVFRQRRSQYDLSVS